MNDEHPDDLIMRLLHANAASRTISEQIHAGLPVLYEQFDQIVDDLVSGLPWSILISAPFPVLDAALDTYLSDIPAFAAQRATETGIDTSTSIVRMPTSAGSSCYIAIYRLRETHGTTTIKVRMTDQGRTLLFVRAAPLTPLTKTCTVTLVASFLTWYIRDQLQWRELEQTATAAAATGREQDQRVAADAFVAIAAPERNRSGRPRYEANKWAYREVRERRRRPRDVYSEWEQRLRAEIGENKFALLDNPRDNFNKAIRQRKK